MGFRTNNTEKTRLSAPSPHNPQYFFFIFIYFFYTDRSKAVPLLQFFFVCTPVVFICGVCFVLDCSSLRKHAYSNILKISPPKTESFQIKILIFFQISAQNIDCGYSLEPPRRGGSNEYPQSMFSRRNKKNNVYPCKPQFYYIKEGFKGVKITLVCFRDVISPSLGDSGRLCFLVAIFPMYLGLYIFVRASSQVSDFNNRNKLLTAGNGTINFLTLVMLNK